MRGEVPVLIYFFILFFFHSTIWNCVWISWAVPLGQGLKINPAFDLGCEQWGHCTCLILVAAQFETRSFPSSWQTRYQSHHAGVEKRMLSAPDLLSGTCPGIKLPLSQQVIVFQWHILLKWLWSYWMFETAPLWSPASNVVSQDALNLLLCDLYTCDHW